jgi:hypothetical protein
MKLDRLRSRAWLLLIGKGVALPRDENEARLRLDFPIQLNDQATSKTIAFGLLEQLLQKELDAKREMDPLDRGQA